MTKLVHSFLALAVTSSVLLAQGWSGAPGKGLKYDGGEAFSLKLGNQLQTHYVYMHNENARDGSSFTVRRARTSISGHAYKKNIKYQLTVDAIDNDSSLKDGYITWTFVDDDNGRISLRMGQAKTLFGLEGTGSSKGLFFVERSDQARFFSDARSRGAWVQGFHMEDKLRWNVAVMNGPVTKATSSGESASNDDDELSIAAGVNFDPMGNFTGGKDNQGFKQGDFREGDRPFVGTVGVGYGIENTPSTGGMDTENSTLNVHTAWKGEGFQILGEWFSWTSETDGMSDIDADGFSVAGSYVMPKSADCNIQWGFGARFGSIDLTELGGDEITDIAIVANAFYHGHACKTQVEVMQRDYDNADVTDYVISVAFQILF